MVENDSQEAGPLELAMVEDVLVRWLTVNEQGGEIFAALPAEQQEYIWRHGGSYESFLPVMVSMKPEEREIAHAWLSGALRAVRAITSSGGLSLSQPLSTVGAVAENQDDEDDARRVQLERRIVEVEERLNRCHTDVVQLKETLSSVESLLRQIRDRREAAAGSDPRSA